MLRDVTIWLKQIKECFWWIIKLLTQMMIFTPVVFFWAMVGIHVSTRHSFVAILNEVRSIEIMIICYIYVVGTVAGNILFKRGFCRNVFITAIDAKMIEVSEIYYPIGGKDAE